MNSVNTQLLNKLNNNFIKFSIILIPFFLITGPFIPDLLVSLISIYFIFYTFKFSDFSFLKNKYFKIFLLFIFFCIFSSLLSEYKLYSLKTSFFYFRFGIFVFVFSIIVSKDKNILSHLWLVLLFCYSILTFDGYYQFIFKKNIIGFEIHGSRLSSFFGDELILGSYLSRFFPIFYGLFLLPSINNKFKYKSKIFIYLLMIASIFLIYLSGERSSFFYVSASLLFLLITLNSGRKYIIYIVIFFLSLIVMSFQFNQSVKKRMISQTLNDFGIKSDKIYIFSEQHEGHYLAAIDLIKKNYLIGIGPKNFRNYCYSNEKYSKKPFICTSHPHNTYIQLFLETGFFGLSIILLIFLNICYNILKHIYLKTRYNFIKYNNFQLCIICSFLITLWPLIPSGNFFNNFLSIIYFFPIALFFNSQPILNDKI